MVKKSIFRHIGFFLYPAIYFNSSSSREPEKVEKSAKPFHRLKIPNFSLVEKMLTDC